MIRGIILLTTIIFLTISCDYQPVYKGVKKLNLNLEIKEIEGDNSINSIIQSELKKYSSKDKQKNYLIKILSNYDKISISKDITGKVSIYRSTIIVNFDITDNDNKESKKITIERSFTLKNYLNNFEQINYENSIKKNLSKSIADEFTKKLLSLK